MPGPAGRLRGSRLSRTRWAGGLVTVSDGNEGCTCFCSETVIIPRQEQKHCSQNRCCCVARLLMVVRHHGLADITAILHGTIVQPAQLTSSAAQAVSLVEAALCHDEQISTASSSGTGVLRAE